MAVTPTTLRLARRVRTDLLKITDQHDRALVRAWADAWDDVAGQLDTALLELINANQAGVLSQSTILRSQRLNLALDVVARRLTQLTTEAGNTVTSDLLKIARDAAAAQEELIASQIPKAELDKLEGWARVDPRQINQIVTRSTERITSQLWPISAEADAAIRRELVSGLAAGRGPKATARAIVQRAEGQFNGGLSRAMTIARTETLDAHRRAAQIAHKENSKLLRGWMWLAATSTRTCPACLGMNGTEHELTEPGPLGHQNCRCARVPLTKSWEDLGIDIPEPEPALTGSQAWFDGQDEKTQRQILGPARYAAYKRGDFPMSKWATRRSTDGWRDSYVPAPAPKPR